MAARGIPEGIRAGSQRWAVIFLALPICFLETGPAVSVTPDVRRDLERLCAAAYSALPWYGRGVTPPLIQLVDKHEKGGVCFVAESGRIVAAHGFCEMETKNRFLSWGPACEPGHEAKAQPLIQDLLDRGRALGKERIVVVLRGEPGGEDTRWYVEQHRNAGIPLIMTRLDMRADIDSVTLRDVPEPPGSVWQPIDLSKLEEFLPLYGEVFATSDSPLTKSWAQRIEERRWWFEQMAQGEEGELVPGGWATLVINGRTAGFVLLTMEDASTAHISDLGLVDEVRGRHLGWVLMARAVALAKKAGATRLSLGVEIQNRVAISLYEAAGFKTPSRTAVLLRYLDAGKEKGP